MARVRPSPVSGDGRAEQEDEMLTYQELLAQRAGLPLRSRRRGSPPAEAGRERQMDAVERRLARHPALAAKVVPETGHTADESASQR